MRQKPNTACFCRLAVLLRMNPAAREFDRHFEQSAHSSITACLNVSWESSGCSGQFPGGSLDLLPLCQTHLLGGNSCSSPVRNDHLNLQSLERYSPCFLVPFLFFLFLLSSRPSLPAPGARRGVFMPLVFCQIILA